MNNQTAIRPVGIAPEIAFKQAVALRQQGNLLAAETIYRTLLKQHPNNFVTLHNLAEVLLSAGRTEEALQYVRKALYKKPNSVETNNLLAVALQSLDRHEEALERARRAIATDAAYPDAHSTLAWGLAYLGRTDEARRAFARAIELAPDRPANYFGWGSITRWTDDEPRLATLEALAQKSASRSLDDQVHLHFALAKAYADCGDIERSFRRQIEGGAIQRKLLQYDVTATLRHMEALCSALGTEWIQRHARAGNPSALPVFILGMPRSGTTLVEQILASHPKVRALGERPIFEITVAGICRTPSIPETLAPLAANWSDSELGRLGSRYVEAARKEGSATAARITDKAMSNFQYIGLIHAALPNASIIHTCRDPIDTCLSLFSTLFTGGAQPYSYDLGELGRSYRAYEKMMAHWHSVLPAGVILDVKYEDVVDDVERQARRIIAHCGLEWDDACLEFYKADRAVRTASHAQVRQPIYRSSVGRKRPPRELLLPLLEGLGVDYVASADQSA